MFPDDSTVLDASASHDDQKIVKYRWEQSRCIDSYLFSFVQSLYFIEE